MSGKILSSLLITVFTLVLLGSSVFCSQARAEEEKTVREELIFQVEKAIASKYYDYKKRRIIRVYLNDFTSTLQDNGLLKDYFFDGVSASLQQGNQFVLGDFDEVGVDCLLGMSFQNLGKQFVKIDAEIMDGRTGRTVANVSETYPLTAFSEPAFAEFKESHALDRQTARAMGNTRLVVRVDSSGKSVDEYEVYTSTYTSTTNSVGQIGSAYDNSDDYSSNRDTDYNNQTNHTGQYQYKEKVGRSSIYPTDIEVFINNRPFQPNSEGIAFDQLVKPGSFKVTVKFRKAFWDGVRRNEVKGRSFSKSFQLDLQKDEKARFDIAIKLNGDDAQIAAVKRKVN